MLLFSIAGDGHDDRTALTSTVESVARGLLGGINRAVGENIRSARRAFRRRELRRAAGGAAGLAGGAARHDDRADDVPFAGGHRTAARVEPTRGGRARRGDDRRVPHRVPGDPGRGGRMPHQGGERRRFLRAAGQSGGWGGGPRGRAGRPGDGGEGTAGASGQRRRGTYMKIEKQK